MICMYVIFGTFVSKPDLVQLQKTRVSVIVPMQFQIQNEVSDRDQPDFQVVGFNTA